MLLSEDQRQVGHPLVHRSEYLLHPQLGIAFADGAQSCGTRGGGSRARLVFCGGPDANARAQDIREAFELFDSDGSGNITIADLLVTMRAMGYEPTQPEVRLPPSRPPADPGGVSFAVLLQLRVRVFRVAAVPAASSLPPSSPTIADSR